MKTTTPYSEIWTQRDGVAVRRNLTGQPVEYLVRPERGESIEELFDRTVEEIEASEGGCTSPRRRKYDGN